MDARPGASAAMRSLRAASVAITGLGLAVASHVLAGGPHPSATVCVLLVAVLAAVLVPVVAKPLSRIRAVLLVLGLQGIVHVALTLATTSMPERLHDLARRTGHHTMPAGDSGASHGMSHAMDSTDLELSSATAMLLGHAVAAVLLGILLAAVDRSLTTLIALLATWIHRLRLTTRAHEVHGFDRLCAALDQRRRIPSVLDLPPPQQCVSDAARRRGPPRAALTFS